MPGELRTQRGLAVGTGQLGSLHSLGRVADMRAAWSEVRACVQVEVGVEGRLQASKCARCGSYLSYICK